ncbi:hypothetical protein [Vibrio aestuarianus]|uniref:Uncharacterized protein n=1 Tax=Vibrio aestuarianus TaxID=28171 RepID=A0ABM9FNU0_9VIBR|nr:hypothetical protein [Vibrio aestuarianus]MDE1213445.1 hypothetical protein [Vibrio aestuarianus]MDE1216433.1 hypothetical protein [Vibrio aestuarianus]MDE1227739.1 hypothetical protein [Vibrio aestuarianus]MDE1256209.1 hypothetical protein [Vibrio aestuarianus]MDE1260566.1 hypothetical protein [Vibrio aestuarianus]
MKGVFIIIIALLVGISISSEGVVRSVAELFAFVAIVVWLFRYRIDKSQQKTFKTEDF